MPFTKPRLPGATVWFSQAEADSEWHLVQFLRSLPVFVETQPVNPPLVTLCLHKRLPNPVTREERGILAYCQELLPLQHPRSFLPVGFGLKLFMPTSGLFPTFISRVMPGLTGSVVPCQAGLMFAKASRSLFWRAIVPYLIRRVVSHPPLTSERRFPSIRRMRGGVAQRHKNQ